MYRALFMIVALCVFTVTQLRGAGAGPDEVAGVRWDSTPAQVREILSKRPGIALQAETADALTFTGGSFAGFDAKAWRFTFTDGKLSSVQISIQSKPGQDAKGWFADQDFAALQRMLEKKYGKTRVAQDPNFQARSWEFRESVVATETKAIELYRGWSGTRDPLELTYTYTRSKGIRVPPAPPKPKEDI